MEAEPHLFQMCATTTVNHRLDLWSYGKTRDQLEAHLRQLVPVTNIVSIHIPAKVLSRFCADPHLQVLTQTLNSLEVSDWWSGSASVDLRRFSQLSVLRLNGIHRLTNAAFAHKPRLLSLSLHCCDLGEMSTAALQPLWTLTKLSISASGQHRHLTPSIPTPTSSPLKELHLDLFDDARGLNKAISTMTLLESLQLRNSICQRLTDDSIRHLVHLTRLYIQDPQRLETCDLSWRAFEKLACLKDLCMENTPCYFVSERLFASLTGLESLHLAAASLEHVTDRSFDMLSSLTRLSLPHCNRFKITGAMFAGLTLLQTLNLFSWKTYMVKDAIVQLTALKRITMEYYQDPGLEMGLSYEHRRHMQVTMKFDDIQQFRRRIIMCRKDRGVKITW